ncbi:hypothetical protein ScPMuIL_015027 [Solemya velum]
MLAFHQLSDWKCDWNLADCSFTKVQTSDPVILRRESETERLKHSIPSTLMERTDSTTAMLSLVGYAGESDKSEDEDDDDVGSSAVDNISDEDADNSRPPSRAPDNSQVEDENSSSSIPDSRKPPIVPRRQNLKAKRLVSYGPDEEEKSDSDKEESGDEAIREDLDILDKRLDSSLNVEIASSLSRSVQNKSADEIEIPSEPPGKCSKHLQEKIAKLYEKTKREGSNLIASIQRKKEFRNPSIYEKLIEFCHIDEKGTNYPPEVYDPYCWGKESYYDALDKAQKAEMEKREKERKERTKIEFVTGTKKITTDGPSEEKKRKTKWDTQPQVVTVPGIRTAVTLTTTATGTKSTIIPAVGNITKKPVK